MTDYQPIFYWPDIFATPGHPKRQQIIFALDARLKTILVADGYKTNLGQNVSWWRQEPYADNESGISCEDSSAAPEWIGAGLQLQRLNVEIRIVMPVGAQAAEMRAAAADVIRAVGTDLTFGGLVEDCVQGDEPMSVEQEATRHGGTIINLALEYVTEPWNPYA